MVVGGVDSSLDQSGFVVAGETWSASGSVLR